MNMVIKRNATRMKKVLIALDYDPTAFKIAEIGHALAKSMNARTILLHVVSDATYYSSLNYSPIIGFGNTNNVVEVDTAEAVRELAENYLSHVKRVLGDEKVETIVSSGDFADSILQTSADFKTDLVVMGTHGRRGLEKLLVGSVAEKVLHQSLIPLLIIPNKAPELNK
jgi:nucleotide-binding universal stress UspA family protein